MINPAQRLVEIAQSFIGVMEIGGDNRGSQVEMFQRAVDGRANREPWCLSFVQYCVKKVDQELGSRTILFQTEHVLTLWNKTNEFFRTDIPEVGALFLWHKYHKGSPTGLGHVGIIRQIVNPDFVNVVEGNTGNGLTLDRDGDGVYCKRRNINGTDDFRRLGFLRAWNYNDNRR